MFWNILESPTKYFCISELDHEKIMKKTRIPLILADYTHTFRSRFSLHQKWSWQKSMVALRPGPVHSWHPRSWPKVPGLGSPLLCSQCDTWPRNHMKSGATLMQPYIIYTYTCMILYVFLVFDFSFELCVSNHKCPEKGLMNQWLLKVTSPLPPLGSTNPSQRINTSESFYS